MTLWELTKWAFTDQQGGFFKKLFKKAKGVLRVAAPVLGGVAGGFLGGPAGAAIGGKLGGFLGGALGAGGGVLAAREQRRRLGQARAFLGAPGQLPPELVRQVTQATANRLTAAGFGRSGALGEATASAIARVGLQNLGQQRQLAGQLLGVPSPLQTGIQAGTQIADIFGVNRRQGRNGTATNTRRGLFGGPGGFGGPGLTSTRPFRRVLRAGTFT